MAQTEFDTNSMDSQGEDSCRYRVSQNFLLREIGGENVLVPVGEAGILNNSVISLNDTCAFIWKQFQTPLTIAEVVLEAQKQYEGEPETIEGDIRAVVREYLQFGLLEKE